MKNSVFMFSGLHTCINGGFVHKKNKTVPWMTHRVELLMLLP